MRAHITTLPPCRQTSINLYHPEIPTPACKADDGWRAARHAYLRCCFIAQTTCRPNTRCLHLVGKRGREARRGEWGESLGQGEEGQRETLQEEARIGSGLGMNEWMDGWTQQLEALTCWIRPSAANGTCYPPGFPMSACGMGSELRSRHAHDVLFFRPAGSLTVEVSLFPWLAWVF